MYFRVSVAGGLLDIDYKCLVHAIQLSDTEAVVQLRHGYNERSTWRAITEDEFKSHFPESKPAQVVNPLQELLELLQGLQK